MQYKNTSAFVYRNTFIVLMQHFVDINYYVGVHGALRLYIVTVNVLIKKLQYYIVTHVAIIVFSDMIKYDEHI